MQGPHFQDISRMMQPEHVISLCSLIASVRRCSGLWRLQEVMVNSRLGFFGMKNNGGLRNLRRAMDLLIPSSPNAPLLMVIMSCTATATNVMTYPF